MVSGELLANYRQANKPDICKGSSKPGMVTQYKAL